MSRTVIDDAKFVKHPTNEGVFLKHFFSKDDTGGCFNNVEVNIIPGFQIAPHIHENSSEYFYVISGTGEYLNGSEWISISKGSVFVAPKGTTHALKNTGKELLVIFSIFSPATR